jgi:acyl-CoA hydrolase
MRGEIRPDEVDFSKIVQPGDTVMWTQGAGEPLGLINALLEQRHRIGPFSVFVGAGYANTLRLEHTDLVTVYGMGAVGSNRAICKAGKMRVIPCHLSDLPGLLSSGALKVDVVLMQVSARDETGVHSVGGVNGYVQYALPRARVALAEINEAAPWTASTDSVDLSQFDLIVHTDRGLIEVAEEAPSAIDLAIAANIAGFIEDGAILQVGIGSVPRALFSRLGDRRNLGIHSGVIGDAFIELAERGVINNSTKVEDAGKSVVGALVGSKRLYNFAHGNKDLLIEPVLKTHAHTVLSRLRKLIAVNSAIEVDLTGQVGSEVVGTSYVGTIGGQVDFVRGALASPGGRSIIGLPSRTGRGTPRIVPRLTSGVATVPRSDADVMVTEFGAAELRGKPISERVQAMIAIAHPEDREELARSAKAVVAGV